MAVKYFILPAPGKFMPYTLDLSSVPPNFSSDRVIADIGNSTQFDPNQTLEIAVNRDQIFGDIEPVINGVAIGRTGYLTIPAEGTGIGTAAKCFQMVKRRL